MPHEELSRLLSTLQVDSGSEVPSAAERAIQLARQLQQRGTSLQSPAERRQQAELERMMQSPSDRATLTQLTDQAFRSQRPRRAADQLTHILDVQGIPRFFSTLDRAMLKGFQSFGSYLPGVSVPLVKDKMREETANVILPAESELLADHLENRRQHGVRMNVNYLGEALLGEDDARRRLESYLSALQLPEIEVISVKVSTIYSQITPLARRRGVEVLCDRMELLYRAAAKARFTRADGTTVAKFVYLDMEEYRDLTVTVDTFLGTLGRPGLGHIDGGIALQAYIPDSFEVQKRINAWARDRVDQGGAPVTIRLVKGANMEAERVEASIAGWEQAPYKRKGETDANYKRMLHEALEPDNARAVRVGVASHNLFEVAYALVVAHERGVLDHVQFEMLEGMANHQRRALGELVDNMLLYAPATKRENFVNAIGYLIRRMDENTGPENFLRHAFKLQVDSEEWVELENGFVSSFERIPELRSVSRRTQDRRSESVMTGEPCLLSTFVNEPDTDFSLDQNLRWGEEIVERWKGRLGSNAAEIPLVVAGEEILEDRDVRECRDPSRPGTVVGRYRHASDVDIERALSCAHKDPKGWRSSGWDERWSILAEVAGELCRHRRDLIGTALADGGKLLTESDPEVSEAIDFVRYYSGSAREFVDLSTVAAEPKGVVVVVPPWNFPIAIPCGGVSAALAAGNTVILKPASDTVMVAYELCKCFWDAGVPKEALQFVPCSGATGGAKLVRSGEVDAVILTGGTDTALRMLEAKPDMFLLAETGGKNATVVTAMSDRELAIKHIVQSAFGHSGQKCSATSLLILEEEVYNDPAFKETLSDAARSLKVGSAWELDTRMGPMIRPPSGDLESALKELEKGESWALMPQKIGDNPNLYSPAIKWGVSAGSYTHMTEFFGPVLAVLKARNLDHAIGLVNQTGYGLTSGLESLDPREQEIWREEVAAGNLYINRVTTGAIVGRQPFGGIGKSAFGPGIKAGGPNYVAQLTRFSDRDLPVVETVEVARPELESLRLAVLADTELEARDQIGAAIVNYDTRFLEEFAADHDDVRLVGQDNIRSYQPVPSVRVRVHPADTSFEVFARVIAAKTVGCRITVSSPPGLGSPVVEDLDRLTESWAADVEFVEETDAVLARVIAERQTDRLRYAAPDRVPEVVRRAIGDNGVYIADAPVLAEGRIEFLWYLTEQSISHDYHRYGNVGARHDERRRPVL